MKRGILFFAVLAFLATSATAQTNTNSAANKASLIKAKAAALNGKKLNTKQAKPEEVDSKIKFMVEEHNFGTIPEGPAVSFDFEFKNTSNTPIQLEHVQASCGCTTPNWSKDPILPGKSSKVTATYNTKGRPGNFYKTITVRSTAGTKTLKIKGVVEKAPTSSVPKNNNSMIKH